MDRYVIVAVEYEPDAKDAECSLGWLVRELRDAGLTMTEDTQAVREWAGVVDGDTYARFADGWDLGNKPDQPSLMQTEHGCLAAHRYTWDGMEWELSGWSPIVWMSIAVSEPIEAELCLAEGDLPFVDGG
jgi:hypothetical protein